MAHIEVSKGDGDSYLVAMAVVAVRVTAPAKRRWPNTMLLKGYVSPAFVLRK